MLGCSVLTTRLLLHDEPARDEYGDADAEDPWTWTEWSCNHDRDNQEPHAQQLERAADVVRHHEMLGPVTWFLALTAFQFAPGA